MPLQLPDTRQTAFSVTEVAEVLTKAIDNTLGQIWIKGELRELRKHRNGHWYFSLADEKSQLRCVMWQSHAQRVKADPKDGAEVFLLARPTFWGGKGDLRLSAVTLLQSEGIGAQQLAYLKAREALMRDGLFDPMRKRPLPELPVTIALITSLDGAALGDMVSVARRRWPSVRLLVLPATVQGQRAEGSLIRALALLERVSADLCVIGRGGGAKDDLVVFNSEAVCRAAARAPIPIISAVGHETDLLLLDESADRRAPTPSAAMEMALPDREEIVERIATLGIRLGAGLRRRTELLRERMLRSGDRMRHAMHDRLRTVRVRVDRLGAQLQILSPLKTLERGYAVPRNQAGAVLRRREEFRPGERFDLQVRDGIVAARTESP